MLNVLGGVKVYTVPEIDMLIKSANGYTVVDKLPTLSSANTGLVYYKKSTSVISELKGYKREGDSDDTEFIKEEIDEDEGYTVPVYTKLPVLIPYIVGHDEKGRKMWYTTSAKNSESTPLTDEEIKAIWKKYDYTYPKMLITQKTLAVDMRADSMQQE